MIVRSTRPLFVFNNQVAITDQKTQVAQSDFDSFVIAAVPHFYVASTELNQPISSECIRYTSELSLAVHALYDVEWVDSSLIKFHDKQHEQITVLGCADTKAETILQPACRQAIALLLERKPVKRSAARHSSGAVAKVGSDGGKGTKNDWCIDRRFKGQMIVFPGGRVTNEKVVCG